MTEYYIINKIGVLRPDLNKAGRSEYSFLKGKTMDLIIYGMIYLGSALMVYNIYGFIRYALYIKGRERTGGSDSILYIPIFLLVMFLLGYIAVGIFVEPNIIVSAILFGGSVFVFIMYILLKRITNRIVENERNEAKLMAEQESSRVKNEFLSVVSHEMRTPMNVIIGLDSIALKDRDVPDTTRSYLEKIGSSAKHLLGMINNILDMNSIEAGELSAKCAPFSLGEAIEQVSAIINTLCDEKGLEYTLDMEDGIDGAYKGDEMMLKQVLIAILDNAVKYTDAPGKVSLSITDAWMDEERAVKFEINDTGVGIDKDFLPKIFDAFTKEDNSSTTIHGGSGIGLALTKKMVALMEGTIEVESKKGTETKFTVTLPLSLYCGGTMLDASGVSLEGRRVLIVEDVPENAEIAADLLELEGVVSEHAENGKVGVEMFESSPEGYYDAILMDLRMPVMDGLTATRAIRALVRPDAESIPIIALTANAFDSDIAQTFEAGMNAHLAKPADADMLYSTLRECIENA